MAQGLGNWVSDYIIARSKGWVAAAKELKKAIDMEIKRLRLSPDEVYFYFGDPDNPTVRKKVQHDAERVSAIGFSAWAESRKSRKPNNFLKEAKQFLKEGNSETDYLVIGQNGIFTDREVLCIIACDNEGDADRIQDYFEDSRDLYVDRQGAGVPLARVKQDYARLNPVYLETFYGRDVVRSLSKYYRKIGKMLYDYAGKHSR